VSRLWGRAAADVFLQDTRILQFVSLFESLTLLFSV